jgi:predicted ATPase
LPDAPTPSSPVTIPSGERRQATVVFSDLSGYTALNERLDPEEVEPLVGRIKDAAVRIVERYGGIVNQFVGDEVLALFGIPTAHEDDPVRAVQAALEMHALVRQLSPEVEARIGQSLRLHTGIHTGLIVTNRRDDRDGVYGVTGDTVNIGARLKGQAAVDDILVSAETQHLIAPFFETSAVATTPMKGKATLVDAYRIVGKSEIHTRFEASAQRGFTPYTGRERELATLHSCLEKALAGQGQLVTLMGEAGVGKSRLLYEFRHRLDRHQVTVVQGWCHASGITTSYLPFLEVLRRGLGLRDEDPPAVLLEKAVANISAVDASLEYYLPLYLHLLSIPSDYALPAHLQGEELQYAIREALAALPTLNAQRRPTVLILEDWHWADEASDAALQHLMGVIAQSRLLVMITYRPDYQPRWSHLSFHTSVSLHPLNVMQTEAISTAVFGVGELPPGLGALIYARTGGNPFFVEEVCRSLREEGIVALEDGRAVLTRALETLTLPDTVQAIIRTRLDRLDADAKHVVRLASVIGRAFGRRLLDRLYMGQAPLTQVLDTLKGLEIIQQTRVLPEAEYMFTQVLTQEVAYETLLLQRRKVLHGLVGEAIETLYPDRLAEQVDLLQHHFSRAENWSKAVHYGRQAAEKAERVSQFHEAVTLLEQIRTWLLWLPDDQGRQECLIDILLQQEHLHSVLGQREQQQGLITESFALLQPTDSRGHLAEAYVRQGDLSIQLGRFDEAERAIHEALSLRRSLSDAAGESATLKSLGYLRLHQGLYDEALACNEAALAIDRQRGDAAAIATDLTNLGAVLRHLGDYDRALACLDEALQLCETTQDLGALGRTLYHIAQTQRRIGDFEGALAYYQRFYDICVSTRNKAAQVLVLAAMAAVYWEQGKTDDSLHLYRDAAQLARDIRFAQALSQVLRTLSELLLVLNEPAEALPYLLESAAVFANLQEPEKAAESWNKVASIYEQTLGEYREALAAWDQVRALRRQMDDRRGTLEALLHMGHLARRHLGEPTQALQYVHDALDLAVELDDRARQSELLNTLGIIEWQQGAYTNALGHYEQALQLSRDLGDTAHVGLMLNSLGVTLRSLGRYDEALAHLQVAVATNRQAGQRLLEGHGLAVLGDVYRDRGEYDQALHHYRASLDLRREIGDRRGEGWMLHAVALVYAVQNVYTRARDYVAQALAIAEEDADAELCQACIQVRNNLPAGE